jgi:hypothetical protein
VNAPTCPTIQINPLQKETSKPSYMKTPLPICIDISMQEKSIQQFKVYSIKTIVTEDPLNTSNSTTTSSRI